MIENSSQKTIMIVAGGTGGHVFPGIAVARGLIVKNYNVVWLGTQQGLDAKLVPAEGITFFSIPMVGLRGKGIVRLLTTPFRLIKTIFQSMALIRKIQPDAILGMGGYVTAPAGIAAWLLRKKLVIHEQNAIAGMSNRYLAKIATQVLQAFPDTFASNVKAITVGNPVRAEIAELLLPQQRMVNRSGKINVLVVGGSLGAHAINHVMPAVFEKLHDKIELHHQTGVTGYSSTQAAYATKNLQPTVLEFIKDMAAEYAWADIVICRAGALTVSELAAAGIGSILIPLPIAVDDHQTANAKYLTNHNAGILLAQKQLSAEKLIELLNQFYDDRNQLVTMAIAARKLAMTDAVEQVIANL